jgi:hypothetical protein
LDLHGVPVVFEHQPSANPVFVEDIITTQNFIDAQVTQTTGLITYGLTNRIDISLAAPVLTVKLSATSNATIQRIGTADEPDIHSFGTANGGTQKSFFGAGSATGIGDVIARIKGTAFKWSGGGIAAGLDVRLPTGDPYNFLGSGALGAKPFVAISGQAGRLSPHVNAGFQWNGKSVLAGDVVARTKANLPKSVFGTAGADIGVSPKLTLALDVLEEHVTTDHVFSRTYIAANGQKFPTIGFQRSAYDILSGSTGFKINAGGRFVFTANMLFRLNHTGLRSKVIPLIGLSYTL